MSRHSRAVMGMLALAWLALAWPGRAADTLQYKRGDKIEDVKGVILTDDFTGVSIQSAEGPKFWKARQDVVKVVYGDADNRSFDEAVEKYEGGEYPAAQRVLKGVWETIGKMRESHRAMFSQYVRYYRAMCSYQMGLRAQKDEDRRKAYKEAMEEISVLVAKIPDTAFYFEVMLMDAQCREAFSLSQAKERYAYLENDFKKKIEESKQNVQWAKKYLFLAAMGNHRITMQELIQNKASKDQVAKLLEDLRKLEKSEIYDQYADGATRTEMTRIIAMALLYLEKYEDLVGILDSVVRAAQKDDDADSLGTLYLQRANAYYALGAQEKDEAKKKALQERALLDYLRADLVFPLDKAEQGKANLRIADLFIDLRYENWKLRARKHLKVAKDCGAAELSKIEAKWEAAQ